MKNKALKVLLLGGFYLQTILSGFGSASPSFLFYLPQKMWHSLRDNLQGQCDVEWDNFCEEFLRQLRQKKNVNEYILADPSNCQYCQQYLQQRKDSCLNWVRDTIDAEGIELNADAIKYFFERMQTEYNERLDRRMYVRVRENGFMDAKRQSDAIINGNRDVKIFKKFLKRIDCLMDYEATPAVAFMVYWLLRETAEKKPVIAIILEEWLRRKGLESWPQAERTYSEKMNSSESSDSESRVVPNDEDELLSTLVQLLMWGCEFADAGDDLDNFKVIVLLWRVLTADVNGFPVWYCLSCCGDGGRKALAEFSKEAAKVVDFNESFCSNNRDLWFSLHNFWMHLVKTRTTLPNGETVYLRNAVKFLPHVDGSLPSWHMPDDMLKAIQRYGDWYMQKGAMVNDFAGHGLDYPNAAQLAQELQIDYDTVIEWRTDASCNGTKWTWFMFWVHKMKKLYLSYLSIKGFTPGSVMDAKVYLGCLLSFVRSGVISLSTLKHLLFDKTIVDGFVSQESVIAKILNNGGKDTLNGIIGLCRAMTESNIIDVETRQRLLKIKSKDGESIEFLLYNKAPDVLEQLQASADASKKDLVN